MAQVRRILGISIGNTSLFCGVFSGDAVERSFRLPAADLIRLPNRIRGRIDDAILCSVVPAFTPDVLRLVRRIWKIEGQTLTALSPHGLKIAYRRPRELGADRVAAALGAHDRFPGKNVVVVDCGTATTVTALRRDGMVAGGAIMPGLTLWPQMLAARTAQLPRVRLARPRAALGRSPTEGITSGVFFGHAGAIREVATRIAREAFGRAPAIAVGTGGHAPLFAREKLFTELEPQLILQGLRIFAMRRHRG